MPESYESVFVIRSAYTSLRGFARGMRIGGRCVVSHNDRFVVGRVHYGFSVLCHKSTALSTNTSRSFEMMLVLLFSPRVREVLTSPAPASHETAENLRYKRCVGPFC